MPYVVSTFLVTEFLFGRTRRPFFSEIYESIQSVFLVPAVLSTIRHPHKPSFKVTPKGMGIKEKQLSSLSLVSFALLSVNAVPAFSGGSQSFLYPDYRDDIAVTLGWRHK